MVNRPSRSGRWLGCAGQRPKSEAATSGTSSSSATAATYSQGRNVFGTHSCAPQASADSANAASISPLKRRSAGTRTSASR